MIHRLASTAAPIAAAVVASGSALLLGTGAVLAPRVTATAAGVSLVLGLALAKPLHLTWLVLSTVLAGALVLGYGFANVGVMVAGFPLPATDLALAFLLGVAVLGRQAVRRLPFSIAVGVVFFALGALRLAQDLPEWGTRAVRDFTLPLETLFLVVGFWAVRTFGLPRLINLLRAAFLVALLYFVLYPWRDEIAAASPLVGLQRPVPLFGSFPGAWTATGAALLFFTIVRPLGWFSFVPAALGLGLVALYQSRGLYLAVPLAVAIVWLLSHSGAGQSVRRELAGFAVAGLAALALIFAAAPAGRMGPVSPDVVVSQLATLRGEQGPGEGSLHQRLDWLQSVVGTLNERPEAWLIGIGFGPDLANGFRVDGRVEVRKPHNDYLEILARLGALGLALFLALVGSALTQIVRSARRASETDARFLWWVFAAAVVYLFIAATQPLLAFPYGTVPLFTFLGAALAVGKDVQAREGRSRAA